MLSYQCIQDTSKYKSDKYADVYGDDPDSKSFFQPMTMVMAYVLAVMVLIIIAIMVWYYYLSMDTVLEFST